MTTQKNLLNKRVLNKAGKFTKKGKNPVNFLPHALKHIIIKTILINNTKCHIVIVSLVKV